ncbi:MAG: hypothetical protein ACK5M3_02450 [Dysgonomonas sp.]
MRNIGVNIAIVRKVILSTVCSTISSGPALNTIPDSGTQSNTDKINPHTDTLGL